MQSMRKSVVIAVIGVMIAIIGTTVLCGTGVADAKSASETAKELKDDLTAGGAALGGAVGGGAGAALGGMIGRGAGEIIQRDGERIDRQTNQAEERLRTQRDNFKNCHRYDRCN